MNRQLVSRTTMYIFLLDPCEILDRFRCSLIGPPPPVVGLEAEGVDGARETVEGHHVDEEVGVVLRLHARSLGAACF